MDVNDIGARVKAERQRQKITLKQLSERTGLSVGFLSQFERGLSSIAIDSFTKIAEVLSLPVGSMFADVQAEPTSRVVRAIELKPKAISSQIYQYVLSNAVQSFNLLPRIYVLMPRLTDESIELYSHEGEEFIYVLEGVITLRVADERHLLYPGDSIQIHSMQPHNWVNRTGNVARILTINLPNPFLSASAEDAAPDDHWESEGRP